MLLTLLLAAAGEPDGISSLFAVAETLLDPDSRANGFLLGRWLELCVSGLRRAHPDLARWAEFEGLEPGRDVRGCLNELFLYCQALGIRGPPSGEELVGLNEVLLRHARTTGRFLFGSPSQDRRSRVAP
jgi:hypothetical protein